MLTFVTLFGLNNAVCAAQRSRKVTQPLNVAGSAREEAQKRRRVRPTSWVFFGAGARTPKLWDGSTLLSALHSQTFHNTTSCARGDTIGPARCTHAAAHLQSIAYTPYVCGA